MPKLLTYNSLVNEIKKIDVGRVYSIQEEFSNDIDDENINGALETCESICHGWPNST